MAAINGFLVSKNRDVLGVRTFKVPRTAVLLPVRSDVAPLLIGLAREFNERVEPLKQGECWGYAYRPVRGGRTPSFHAAAIAIDLNAPRHPLGRRNTFSAAQASTCRALARKYGCRWGGDYKRRADEMHFEVIVPHARALELVRTLQVAPTFPPWPGVSFSYPPAMHDARVSPWQDRMRQRGWEEMVVDGIYGEMSARLCRAFQEEEGLTADGIVGPKTWKATWDLGT